MKGARLGKVVWSLTGTVALVTQGALTLGLHINLTASVPVGLWRVERGGSLERGSIVSLCPPDTKTFRWARKAGYIPHGACPGGYAPLFKPLTALPGDEVRVTPEGITVNGEPVPNTAPLTRDRTGQALTAFQPGRYQVAPGSVWLVSSHPRSFDSRYFGPVPQDNIQGVMWPLWIGEGP